MSATPSYDPRWIRLHQDGAQCSCGMRHDGFFPLEMLVPLGWPGELNYEPDNALRMDGDFLSKNFCVREGKYFALRARLPIVCGPDPRIAVVFTAWVSLNRPDFEAFFAAVNNGTLNPEAKAPARLVNRIGSYPDTYGMMGVATQAVDGPPYFAANIEQAPPIGRHELGIDQRQGASLDRLLQIYAAQGHDMRGDL